jgi:poly(A) polymerase
MSLQPTWSQQPTVQKLMASLASAGIEARFVGGCVRNWLVGQPVGDIDIAVDKPPDAVTRALEAHDIKVVPTGVSHGTVTAIVAGHPFEVTTLRRDVETDGRHAVVAFTDDWRADASRRDFTFNALYLAGDGTLWDYFDGRADLEAGRVRFIGDPDRRIAEDRLRILRFFRFNAWYGRAPIDPAGFDACRRNAAGVRALSGERVRNELLRLLQAPVPGDALEAMAEAGALDHWLPEYAGTARLRALAAREGQADALRRLAAIVSAGADASLIGKRLKLSTQQTLRLAVMLEPLERDRDPRVLLYRLGRTLFEDRVLLAGDAFGDWHGALELARGWTPPTLPVGGTDALRLGVKEGPRVGKLLEAVERWWIAGGFAADRAACLAELERLAREPSA